MVGLLLSRAKGIRNSRVIAVENVRMWNGRIVSVELDTVLLEECHDLPLPAPHPGGRSGMWRFPATLMKARPRTTNTRISPPTYRVVSYAPSINIAQQFVSYEIEYRPIAYPLLSLAPSF